MSSLRLHVRAAKSAKFPFHHDRIMIVSGALPRGTPWNSPGVPSGSDGLGRRELVGQLRSASPRGQGPGNSAALVVASTGQEEVEHRVAPSVENHLLRLGFRVWTRHNRDRTTGRLRVNKSELIEAIAVRLDGDRKTAATAVDGVLDEITRAVVRGERVALTGFGTFEKRARAARTARNPATGEAIKLKKTSVPAFKAGATLKSFVSGAAKLTKAAPAKKTAKPRAAATTTGPAKKAPAKVAKKTTTPAAKKTSPAKKAPAKKAAVKGTAKKTVR
jgi:DNA-binding protein HU-beta